jgi:NADH dehydrogenase
MIVGASGPIGRAVVRKLVPRDEVRATVRRASAAEDLRQLGAKVAVGSFEQPYELAEILKRVYTLVHLTGGANQVDVQGTLLGNYSSMLVSISAARMAGVSRVVTVSVPGASPEAEHPLLRAKGLAEEALANSGLDHVIIRSTHAYGLGGFWFASMAHGALADPPFVVGRGDQQLAPVAVDDLAAAVAAADDRSEQVAGTWGIEGPDVVTASELVGLLRGDGTSPRPLEGAVAAARLTEVLEIPVSPSTAEFFAMPSRTDAPDAAREFGIELTPLMAGLRSVAERAIASGL